MEGVLNVGSANGKGVQTVERMDGRGVLTGKGGWKRGSNWKGWMGKGF